MAQCFRSLGVEDLMDDENIAMSLVGYAVENGKVTTGYYGGLYISCIFGDMEMVLQTEVEDDSKELKLCGLDMHAVGSSVWKLRCKFDITPNGWNNTEKRMTFSNPDGTGLVPIALMNSDVIPSYLDDDIITVQVVGFAEHVEYYENDEAYEKSLVPDELGKTFGPEEGTLFPVGLFSNNGEIEMDDENQYEKGLTLVHGKVISIYWRKFKLGDIEENRYVSCKIDTEFGEFEIIHTPDQVDDNQRLNMKPGAIINALVTISGDVAIYDYENGLIKDEENNLRVLRSVLEGEDANRLSQVLTEDAVYFSEGTDQTFAGKKEIIEKFNSISKARADEAMETYTSLATISSYRDDEKLAEKIGTRCIIVSDDEKDNYKCIAFVKYNEEGMITNINTTDDSRYIFQLDVSLPEYNPFEELIIPSTYLEAMITRAKLHGFLDIDMEAENILEAENFYDYRDNASRLLDAWPGEIEKGNEEYMRKAFGYLFAKAIERETKEKLNLYEIKDLIGKSILIASYSPDDCWNDRYYSVFEDGEVHRKLVLANKYGKQFYTDYINFMFDDMQQENDYNEDEFISALIAVQKLGECCADYYMRNEIEENDANETLLS